MDKVEIITYLFRSFNKDPHQHKAQVTHFLSECQDYDAEVVDRAVREAIVEETYLPKAWTIVNKCKEQLKTREILHESCFLCNGMGLVYSPFYIGDDGVKLEIVQDTHDVKTSGRYTVSIIGACKCVNGEAYAATRKRVEPWSYIVDGAKENGWDCVFQADYIAKKYTRIMKSKVK